MAAGPPLSHLVLSASSVTDDLGYVALADLSEAIGKDTPDHRIIGGHMITALAARWKLGATWTAKPVTLTSALALLSCAAAIFPRN